MTKLNIFSENIHTGVKVDEIAAISAAKIILKHYLSTPIIFDNSCLFGRCFKSLSFDIVYCDSQKTHEINNEYRQKDYAADIITFAIFADGEEKFVFDGEINLGEIIISLDKVSESAQEKGVSFKEELNFLISHGIMHLLGFDHQTEEDYNFIMSAQASALGGIK